MNRQEMRELILRTMHEYIKTEVSDENAYMSWILIVPDEPTEEDFQSLAEDDEDWKDCVKLFGKLLNKE